MTAEERRVDLSAAVEDDVIELDAGRLLEQIDGDGIGTAELGAADGDLLRVGLGVGNDLIQRFELRTHADHEHELVKGKIGDGGEVLETDRRLPQERRGQKGRGGREDVVGVLLLAGHVRVGDAAASPRLVLHDDRLGKQFFLLDGRRQSPGEDIAAAAGAALNDQGDGLFGIIACAEGVSRPEGDKRHNQKQREQRGQVLHASPPFVFRSAAGPTKNPAPTGW